MTKPYIAATTPFTVLECETAFNCLEEVQALYSYNFARASWNGAKICFFQRSYESPALLYLILKAFNKSAKQIYEEAKKQISEEDLQRIFIYISAFFDNCGNYKSFGDSKFIPEVAEETFEKFLASSEYWGTHKEEFNKIYSRINKFIFAYEQPYGLLGFSDKDGTTGYYSKNVTSLDAEKIKDILTKRGVMSENNRLIKTAENTYVIKVASADQKESHSIEEDGISITFVYGEFHAFLKSVNHYLGTAKKYAANQHQSKMIDQYIEHFRSGDMERHKESQRWWIKDVQPLVETNIGFIESYLDPLRVRAEFEGFVAVVNKKQSLLLTKLVENAQVFLKYLPWGHHFEVAQFKKPDFTSLEVLAFGSSGIPVGINIPNYHDVREDHGFKNVNLGNVYGEPSVQSIQYTPLNEIDLHMKYYKPSLLVVVALHELLGHGTGKLLNQILPIESPLNGKALETCYKENESFHGVFGEIASTYEECKADSVALYLSVYEDVQETLLPDLTKEERWDTVYVAWFDMILGGLKGLEYFDFKSNKWLQSHIGAAFAIFRVLQEEEGVFEIKETQRDGKQYLEIILNKDSLATKGKHAIGQFLKHLQIYKSTANASEGIKYFQKYLEVSEKLMKYRQIVMKNKRPRRLTVQPEVVLKEGKPEYIKYENTAYGCIDSALSHYGEQVDDILVEWETSNQEFSY